MLEKNIIILDDFYDNPTEVRLQALNSVFPKPDKHTYPGRNSSTVVYNQDIHNKIQSAVGRRIVPQDPKKNGADCGYFRISLASDSFEQDIHIDPGNDWAGVLFLNPNNQLEPDSGTTFYRHRRLGLERVPMNPLQGQSLGFYDYEDIRQYLIYGDGQDRSLWDCYCAVPPKYNRLVLFSPYLWHSHGVNFGDSITNGRLVQLFFYHYE